MSIKEKVVWPVASAVAIGVVWFGVDAAQVYAESKIQAIVDIKVRSIERKLEDQNTNAAGQREQIFGLQKDADALKKDTTELKGDVKTVIRLLLEDRNR